MNNQIYQTTNSLEIAYLLSVGFRHKEILPVDDKRVACVFELTNELNNEIIKFSTGKGLVEPTKFYHNYKSLISEINSLKEKKQWQMSKSYNQPKNNWFRGNGSFPR